MARKLQRRTSELLGGVEPTENLAGTSRLFGQSENLPRVVELQLDAIQLNPDQPRKHFDDEAIASLAQSIERHGLKNPVLVQGDRDQGYVLIAGERRLRAHQLLGKSSIFAIITEGDLDEIALVDNVQRVDLNEVEYARALERLADKHGYTQTDLGKVVGRAQPDIARSLSVLRIADSILAEYMPLAGQIAKTVLYELATVDGEEAQRAIWDALKKTGFSIKAVRNAKAEAGPVPQPTKPPADAAKAATTGIKRLVGGVEKLQAYRAALTPEHRQDLLALRAKVDQLLGDG